MNVVVGDKVELVNGVTGTVTKINKGWYNVNEGVFNIDKRHGKNYRLKQIKRVITANRQLSIRQSSVRKTSARRKISKRRTSKRKASTRKVSKRKVSKKASDGCVESFASKYQNRPGPPYPAQECRGQHKKGNDGLTYRSEPAANGVYRWKKQK